MPNGSLRLDKLTCLSPMNDYAVAIVDPHKYRKDIIDLWKNNLPGTPKERFEWMFDNPDGPSKWYLAFKGGGNRAVGSLSIMPKKVIIKDKMYMAGIVGDFMVNETHRAYGPALQLMSIITQEYCKLGFDFLYTYSNDDSEKVMLRAGFKKAGDIGRFAKPIRVHNKIVKYCNSTLSNLISPIIDYSIMLFSKETYHIGNIVQQKNGPINSEIDKLFSGIRNFLPIICERNAKYLKWKYYSNPQYSFNLIKYYTQSGNNLIGYIIFNIQNNIVNIYDFIATDKSKLEVIFACFLKYTRREGYDSVNMKISHNNILNVLVKRYGFYDRNDNTSILVFGDKELVSVDELIFLEGDRNI